VIDRGTFLKGLLALVWTSGAYAKGAKAETAKPKTEEPTPEPAESNELSRFEWIAPVDEGGNVLYEYARPPDQIEITCPGTATAYASVLALGELKAAGAAMEVSLFGEKHKNRRRFKSTKCLQSGDTLEISYALHCSGWTEKDPWEGVADI